MKDILVLWYSNLQVETMNMKRNSGTDNGAPLYRCDYNVALGIAPTIPEFLSSSENCVTRPRFVGYYLWLLVSRVCFCISYGCVCCVMALEVVTVRLSIRNTECFLSSWFNALFSSVVSKGCNSALRVRSAEVCG